MERERGERGEERGEMREGKGERDREKEKEREEEEGE